MPTEVTYERAGITLRADAFGSPDDPGVLLLHGGGQTRHSWHGAAAVLAARGWYAVSLDLRGHGDSDWAPDGSYDLEDFALDVRAVAESFPKRPALVGASLGGMSSLLAIADAPDPSAVASALVLVDVAPDIEPAGVARIRDFMSTHLDGFNTLEEVVDAIAAYNPHRPRPTNLEGVKKNVRWRNGRWYWHWDPQFLTIDPDEPRHARHRGHIHDAARSLKLPTLLVRGGTSDVLSDEGARKLREMVPHAEYVEIGGAGHMVAGDRNDAFTSAVVDFLTRVGS